MASQPYAPGIARHAGANVLARAAGMIALNALIAALGAQPPRPSLDVATLSAEAAAVRRTWLAYLASKAGDYSARAGAPSSHWVEAEQRRWPVYDLASFYLVDNAAPEVIAVERVDADDEYRIVTRFRAGDQTVRPATWWTTMTVTVYAVRAGERWQLANALPRHTRGWRRDTVDPITYAFAPGYPYDSARARRAVAFTDSVASAFGLPRLAPLTYYLTSSVDEVYGIMGLESAMRFGSTGGAAQPVNRMLFSGIPALGEEYRHELTYLLLAPLCCARTPYLVSEGVPTWLGGTAGMTFPRAAQGLAAFLAERPAVSLDSLMSGAYAAAQTYPAGAVLAAMVFESSNVEGVKQLFDAGGSPAELRSAIERLLRRPWPVILHDWRERVMRFRIDTNEPAAIQPDVGIMRER